MTDRLPSPSAPRSTHLAFLDHLAFELHRVTGRNQLMQCLWLYDREVSVDALARTCARLGELPVNRLIEPSRLPFGRPRWVQADGATPPTVETRHARPRQDLMRWADACAHTPVDPVNGPAWHLALQRFDDGTTAVSLVGSHLLFDGMAAMRAIETAVGNSALHAEYPRRGARRPALEMLADLRQAVTDVPLTLAAAWRLAAVRFGSRTSRSAADGPEAPDGTEARQVVRLPSVAALIDETQWDRRAVELRGHPVLLLPAVAARVAAHMGRLRPSDGSASLVMPIERTREARDDRALGMAFVQLGVDPEQVRTDLRQVEAVVKAGVREARRAPDTLDHILPAIAWMPQRATRTIVDNLFSYADLLPVSCTSLGALPKAVACIDGAPCRVLVARPVDVNVTLGDLHRTHGHLVVAGSRFNGTVCVAVEAYRLGGENSTAHLSGVVRRALADLGLDGTLEC